MAAEDHNLDGTQVSQDCVDYIRRSVCSGFKASVSKVLDGVCKGNTNVEALKAPRTANELAGSHPLLLLADAKVNLVEVWGQGTVRRNETLAIAVALVNAIDEDEHG